MRIEFLSEIWPEDPAPSEATNCFNCELHCQRSRVVWGEGNPEAPILAILDNPGAREDKNGAPFVCGTRQTLQRAVFEAGLGMNDIYVTYILKCRPVRRYDKDAARGACLPNLLKQIEKQGPRLAICMGNTAVRSFFGSPDAEVKNMRGVLHDNRGLPTAVSYHPLAVRRRPNLYPQFLQDWQLIAAAL